MSLPNLNFQQFTRLQQMAAQTQAQLNRLNATTRMSGRDFTGLSRVIQDLPFGFIAISNNITQLVPAASAAGLAFSGLVAAFSFAQIGLQNWIRGNNASKSALEQHLETIKKTREALDDYIDGLDDINRTRIRGAQGAQEEIVKLRTLYGAIQDANRPLKERRELVDDLQKMYPAYFKNISDETILTGGAKKAYDELAASILKSSKARAAQETIVDLQKQNIALGEQQAAAAQEEIKAYQYLNKLKGIKFNDKVQGVQGVSDKNLQLITAQGAAQNQYNKALEKTKQISETIRHNQEQMNRLQADAIANIAPDFKQTGSAAKGPKAQFNFFDQFFDTAPDKTKIEQQLVRMAKVARDFAVKNNSLFVGLDKILFAGTNETAVEEGKKFWANFQRGMVLLKQQPITAKDLGFIPTVEVTDTKKFVEQYIRGAKQAFEQMNGADKIKGSDLFSGELAFKSFIENGGQVATYMRDLAKQMKDNLQKISEDFGQNIVFSIGESIGNAFNGDGFSGVFDGIFNLLGNFIQEVGKQMVLASSAMVALKKALKALFANPVAGIAVGVGMIALGQIIKNSVSKVKPFAQGGLVYGDTLALIGEGRGTSRNNPEVVAPLDRLKKIIGGGIGGVTLSVSELRLSGRDLIAAIAVNQASQKRTV